ncbi:TPA: ABC-F family ATP-binding cassette domain-containing protein, partial [Enterococcus faecium]|nr:ABC-F family ATP-binding cassette domain-containing protein [Enterococcus faecium]
EYIDSLTMNSQASHHKRLLSVEDLQLGYENLLFEPIHFTIEPHQRVAISGPNGAGKSSIIHYLLGAFNGKVIGEKYQPKHLSISYASQNYEDNRGTLAEFAEKNQVDYQAFLNNLRKLGMERDVFHNKIEQMSMGQRKKVELAKSLSQPAELYTWDEPLNYLDVFNQEQLEQLILNVKPAMLLVEHDQTFLDKVSTEIISLERI